MRLLLGLLTMTLGLCSFRPATSQPHTFSAVTLNLWHDQQDWPARMGLILTGLRALNPDVIFLQEVLQHATLPNQAEALADSLGYSAYFASVDTVGHEKRYGNAILTRHEVLSSDWKALEPLDDYRIAAHVRIRYEVTPIDLYSTHLHHTPEGAAIRQRQLDDLTAWIARTKGEGPVLLAGDFNAVPDSPEMLRLAPSFTDVYTVFNGEALGDEHATFGVATGSTPRRIDYIFLMKGASGLTPTASRIVFNEPDDEGRWPSDHFGVLATFVLSD